MSADDKREIARKTASRTLAQKIIGCCDVRTPLLYDEITSRDIPDGHGGVFDTTRLTFYEGVTELVSKDADDGQELQYGFHVCLSSVLRLFRDAHVDFECRTDSPAHFPHVTVTGLFDGHRFAAVFLSEAPIGAVLPITSTVTGDHDEPKILPQEKWRDASVDLPPGHDETDETQ